MPSEEIGRMMREKGKEVEDESEEAVKRKSFERGGGEWRSDQAGVPSD